MKWVLFYLSAMLLPLLLGGCAQAFPVPGGTDAVNASYYNTKEDFLTRVSAIDVGMTEKEVLARLERSEDDMIRLKRDEIMMAMTGTNNIEFKGADAGPQSSRNVIRSLQGYRLNYKAVERKHGFSSPIRIRTDEKGFDYTVTLIFRKDRLLEKPILTGGVVNNFSSKTFFDLINSGGIPLSLL
jgi:hypothetical protein